ncbi:penicillin-binding protein activator LpoB [Flavobacterium sp. MFBS3-15]|uniref:penicillin-binding protein activator LpoB n=1 Tax=Flavobacterium sp. MFBS3-15 TaxID=2989816 RepID=UPI0022368A53|nr:penicillin-binding protein activator LpoB [Flavobacterium sp. MFBS3-15]MCW4467847.1 penicillin-binding protein activator LpoB [Flavobacterium sp. MFBS3-15]
MKTSPFKFIAALALGFTLINCGTPNVQRVSENTVTDLSGRWNETDSRLTAEEITAEMMEHSWYSTYAAENGGKKPVIIVGIITNKSHEHIASETFSKDIEKAIINSGRMKLVQGADKREEIRAERADQQNFSSQSTMKKFGLENGADFMLQGTINSIVDQAGKEKTIYYQVDLELTNIQTNDKVWIGDKKIKKYLGNKKM